MIKSLYLARTTATVGESREYKNVLALCKDYIYDSMDSLKELRSTDFNDQVKSLIETYVFTNMPVVSEMMSNGKLNTTRLVERLYEDINQYGPITGALNSSLTDIYCHGVGKGNLFGMQGNKIVDLTDANGQPLYFRNVSEIETVVNKLAYFSGQHLTSGHPILNAQTLQRFRLTASDKNNGSDTIQADGTTIKSPTFSIRMGANKGITLQDMVYVLRTMHPQIARSLVAFASLPAFKMYFAGSPGTGKTTLIQELLKTLKNKNITIIEDTPEMNVRIYDADGKAVNKVKKLWAPINRNDSGDITLPTIRNYFLQSLREKVNIFVLGEVRTPEAISVCLEAAISGQGVMSSLHGETFELTVGRLCTNITQIKQCTRTDAMEEICQCVNLIVGLENSEIDHVIRPKYISEVCREETVAGTRVVENRIFEFHVTDRHIDPNTHRIQGEYRKIGVPKGNVATYIQNSALSDDDVDFLMQEASPEHPVIYSNAW